MYHRTYIWIDGADGTGKTSLICRLLESNRSKDIMVMRFVVSDSVKELTHVSEETPETRAYKKAGAIESVSFLLPPGDNYGLGKQLGEAGFSDRLSDVVVFEGPIQTAFDIDLVVSVVHPLPKGVKLAEKKSVEVGRLDFKDYMEMVTGEELPEDPIVYEEGDEIPFDPEEGEIIEEYEIPDEVGERLIEHVKHGIPLIQDKWVLADSYSSLHRAEVIVINIQSEKEHPAAERLVKELRKLKKDRDISYELFKPLKWHDRYSVYIANLSDPKDKELKKALARIKRPFPRQYERSDDDVWF